VRRGDDNVDASTDRCRRSSSESDRDVSEIDDIAEHPRVGDQRLRGSVPLSVSAE